jgi:L-ascorbate metabolism protein UlaG (beta-lactamase superfamily)
MEDPKFLRPNVIIEPLVNGFYAWAHTVAPAQAALNLANLQVPMLESYLQSPPVHVAASSNPELRGGYFVNIPEDRAGEVRELLNSIKKNQGHMLRFAEAIAEAEDMLQQSASGFDLTPLYAKLPPELAGLVELAYDTNNQPTLRFMEPVLYDSPVYDVFRQSVQLSFEDGIERPFILSTPRLASNEKVLDLQIPFNHPGIEELFKARVTPTTMARLRELFDLDEAQAEKMAGMLTDEPSLAADRHIDGGGRIRYFGHACLVLQTPEAAIITDPFISADTSVSGRFNYNDLPDYLDLALITHGHQDHIVLESLMQLRGRVGKIVVPRASKGNLCDPSLALYVASLGFDVLELDDYGVVEVPGGKVTATPFLGEHADLDIRSKSTYWVELGGRAIFVGADSSGIDPMLYNHMSRHLGQADIAFLGMECDGAPLTWLYQALLTRPVTKRMSDSRKLSGSNAAQAGSIVTELGAAEAYIYAMGEEAWLGHVMATSYTDESYQLKQVEEFLSWSAANGVKAGHLLEQAEWRW